MKKLLLFAVLAISGVFVLSTAAMAYDDLITNDTSAVKEAGGLCGSVSLLYMSADKMWDADGNDSDLGDTNTAIRVPIRVNYGLMDKLTVFGVLPIVSIDDGTDSNSGIGDIWLGAKYAVMPEGLLTVRGALDIPAGSDKDGLGNYGGFGIDVAAMSSKQVDKIGMNGQIGLRWMAEGPDDGMITKFQPGIGVYVDVEGSYSFTEAISGLVGIEFATTGDGKSDGNDAKDTGMNYLDLNVGACYKLAENMGLRGDVIYTVTGENANQYMGVLLRFGYAVK